MRVFLCLMVLVISLKLTAATEYYTLAYRNDPATTAVIGWSGDNGTVHYGPVDHATNFTAYPNTHPSDRTGGAHSITRHFARLSGLQPNTIYYFVIRDLNGDVSERLYFRTLSNDVDDPVSFISGGDTRDGFSLFGIYTENCPSGNCLDKRRDGNKLVAKIRPDFIAFTGDFVMNQITSNTQSEWSTWLNDWQMTITDDGRIFPVAFSRGNHEDMFDVHEMFDIPFDEFYALNIHGGLIRLYMLNSELNACSDMSQLNWLTNDFQMHTGTLNDPCWKFVSYHTPTLAIGKDGDLSADQMNCWIPLFEQHKVRLVMESDSHSTKWTYPSIRNNAGNDFIPAQNPHEGVVYIGEGQWGAPHRDIYYTGSNAKDFVQDAGTFDNFFFVRVTKDTTTIRCVKFENVNGVFNNIEDNLGGGLPSNIVLWNPQNGDQIILTKPIDVTGIEEMVTLKSQVFPTIISDECTVQFNEKVQSVDIEIYNSLGKLTTSTVVQNQESTIIKLNGLSAGVYYLIVKYENGSAESHTVVIE